MLRRQRRGTRRSPTLEFVAIAAITPAVSYGGYQQPDPGDDVEVRDLERGRGSPLALLG